MFQFFLTNPKAADQNSAVPIAALMFAPIRVLLEECQNKPGPK